MLQRKLSGRIKIVIGALLSSFSAVFVRFSDLSPDSAAFYRTGIGALPFLLLVLIKRENLFLASRRAWLLALAAGIFFAADLFCWHRSIHYAGVGLATLFGNFQVFFLTLFGYLILKEQIHARFLISVAIALTGIFLILYSNFSDISGVFGMGLFLGIATSLFYAGYILILKKTQHQKNKPSTAGVMFIISLSTALIFLPYLTLTGTFQMIDNPKDLFCMIGLGCVNQFLAWLLISSGLKEVRTSSAGLILLLQPVLSYAWEMLFFNKAPGVMEIMGASLALFAIYTGSRENKTNRN